MNTRLGFTEYQNQGPKAIFLHGFFEDSRMWQDFLPDAPFHSIAVDLPAYKQSDSFDFKSMAQAAEEVHKVVKKKGWSSYYVFGHSMGGYVGLAFAKMYEKELLGLGLIHSHVFADSDQKKKERDKVIAFVKKFGVEIYAKQFFPNLFAREYNDNFWIHTLSLRATQLDEKAIIQSIYAMKQRPDSLEFLRTTSLPTLHVFGVQDSLMDVDKAIISTTSCSRAMVDIYPNVAHMSMFEHPTRLHQSIRRFTSFCKLSA